jgi:hypothetical protein
MGRPATNSHPDRMARAVNRGPGELAPTDLSSSPVTDPYQVEYMPVRLADELRALGIFPSTGPTDLTEPSKAVQVTTRVDPSYLYAIDRLIERRVLDFKSRQEFFRTAIANYVSELADLIQQGAVKLSIRRLYEVRRIVAETERINHTEEITAGARRAARRLIEGGDTLGAIQALRTVKRFIEDLPYPGLKERMSAAMYGAEKGNQPPEPDVWVEDPVARLWSEVEEGNLDKDDTEIVQGQVKIS